MKPILLTKIILLFLLNFSQAAELTIEDLIERTQRFEGQTEFFNIQSQFDFRPFPTLESGRRNMTSDKSAENAPRDIQESDIYKVGKEGSQLLFLLNNYRGLQVVTFKEGAHKPQLLSRVEPTGNRPNDMYYDKENDKLLVLENIYRDDQGNSQWNSSQSRLLTYDVSDPKAPQIVEKINLKGRLADSRIVGDVLYIATSVYPNWHKRDQNNKQEGYVISYNLKHRQIVAKHKMALPNSYGENMNIVKVGDDKYYLVTILSENKWNWWNRKSLVEVVDISDPQGKIRPSMIVSAKGTINERSNTSIKDDHLVVVSNYTVERAGTRGLRRVAVESFKLPTTSDKAISESEAEYRRLHIERQLQGLSKEAKEEKYKQLIADPELGLKGLFVKTDRGLEKKVSDSVVTVGDTNGLSANLRDVRFQNDLLYVFWVPQNNIDPFDLFHLDDLDNGVKYLKRLQFDGWMDRAIPLNYQGREFVLGLGWVVPSVNNERGRRHPQAKMFEILQRGAQTHILEVSTLTLDSGNMWTNFNRPDKFIEVQLNVNGKGSVLFQGNAKIATQSHASGAKIIGFDLQAAINGTQVFREGAFLTGDAHWLRRVFTNSEIHKINTFSDDSLGVFAVEGIGSARAIERSIATLELARNIKAFLTFNNNVGVQLISKGQNYYYSDLDSKKTSYTELRAVSMSQVDAEVSEVINSIKLKGQYVSFIKDKTDANSAYIVSKEIFYEDRISSSGYIYKSPVKSIYTVSQISVDNRNAVQVVSSTSFEVDRTPSITDIPEALLFRATSIAPWPGPFHHKDMTFVQLSSGEIVAMTGPHFLKLQKSPGALNFIPLDSSSCEKSGVASKDLTHVGDQLVYTTTKKIEGTEVGHYHLVQNFMSMVSLEGQEAKCSTPVNIPGSIKSVGPDHIVTLDNVVLDIWGKSTGDVLRNDRRLYPRFKKEIREPTLISLSHIGSEATIVDMYSSDNGELGRMKLINNHQFVLFENEANTYNDGGFLRRSTSYGPQKFVSISFNDDLKIKKQIKYVNLSLSGVAHILAVYRQKNGQHLALVSSGRMLQLISWKEVGDRPEIKDFYVKDSTKQSSLVVPSAYFYSWTESPYNYSEFNNSLELALGNTGVIQLKLAD